MDASTKQDVHDSVHSSRLKTLDDWTQSAKPLVLIPQPSSDPKDPLNWSQGRKFWFLFVVCFTTFSAALSPTAHQQAYLLQVPLYHKTAVDLSHSITAAVAGLLAGPLFFGPLSHVFGRTSLIFWSLFGVLGTQIWAASMTHAGDFVSFVVSRWLGGMFASIPLAFGPSYLIDIFFLHQRGRAFTSFELSLLLGATASPTIGGFIVQKHHWPMSIWWTIAPIGISIILVFTSLYETGFPRESMNESEYPAQPESFLKNRIATLVPGTKIVPSVTGSRILRAAISPFQIAFAPITIIAGLYTFLVFGFSIMSNILLTIFLQTPVSHGGYGFTPLRNAEFSFCSWAGIIAAQITGWALGDRLPLWACRRAGGVWHPEYRLWNMLLPAIMGPIGLGIFGAALEYHLHYMVLALGFFFVAWSSCLSVPICLNYIVECCIKSSLEVSVAMNSWRLAFAVALGFFITRWEHKVGAGWLFGTAAFLNVFAGLLIGILIWKGSVLRTIGLKSIFATEDGEMVTLPSDAESSVSERERGVTTGGKGAHLLTMNHKEDVV